MKVFYWLLAIMEITLIALLWIYISNFYFSEHFGDREYSRQLFYSDQAIPIIALGVIFNTWAILFMIRDARLRSRPPSSSASRSPSRRREEIDELEKELEVMIVRLEELKRLPGEGDEV
jgi:hypothetical protein